jgi:cytochrome c5
VSLTRRLFQIAGVAAIALSFTAFAASEKTTVADRLAPVGQLCMAGEDCAATLVGAADTGPRTGQQVYDTKCAACHASGAAGAPILGDAAAWEPRIAKGIETLYDNAWNGIDAMPAKGLCMDCTREELDNAVDYMIENSQ